MSEPNFTSQLKLAQLMKQLAIHEEAAQGLRQAITLLVHKQHVFWTTVRRLNVEMSSHTARTDADIHDNIQSTKDRAYEAAVALETHLGSVRDNLFGEEAAVMKCKAAIKMLEKEIADGDGSGA